MEVWIRTFEDGCADGLVKFSIFEYLYIYNNKMKGYAVLGSTLKGDESFTISSYFTTRNEAENFLSDLQSGKSDAFIFFQDPIQVQKCKEKQNLRLRKRDKLLHKNVAKIWYVIKEQYGYESGDDK